MSEMSDIFDFASFKLLVRETEAPGECVWTEKLDGEVGPPGATCNQPIRDGSIAFVQDWLVQHTEASTFGDIPPELYTNAFCSTHFEEAVKIMSVESKHQQTLLSGSKEEASTEATKRRASDPFRFGPEERTAQGFTFSVPPIPLSHKWGNSSDEASSTISNSRTLTFYRSSEGEVTKVQGDDTKPAVDDDECIGDSTQSAVRSETPSTPVKREDSDRQETPVLSSRKRSSLSPDQIRTSQYKKSPSRSRSPSGQVTSRWAEIAFAKMEGDASYHLSPRQHEQKVISTLKNPLSYKDKRFYDKEGWVYAIRDPEIELVKIGFTANPLPEKRLGQLRGTCELSKDAYVIEDLKRVRLLAFKRLEELVHEDLRPHRFYFYCECGFREGPFYREHHEWYDVSDDMAIRTVRVWTKFILQNPYGELRNGEFNHLTAEWIKRIEDREKVSYDETHEDHETRLTRWGNLFLPKGSKGKSKATEVPPASSSDESIKIEQVPIKAEDAPEQTIDMSSIPAYDEQPSVSEHVTLAQRECDAPSEEPKRTLDPFSQPAAKSKVVTDTEALLSSPGPHDISSTISPSIEISPPPNTEAWLSTADQDKLEGDPDQSRSPHALSTSNNDNETRDDRYGEEPISHTELVATKVTNREERLEEQRPPASQSEAPINLHVIDDHEEHADKVSKPTTPIDSEWKNVMRRSREWLDHERSGLPSRTIYSDLIRFRWSLACAAISALYTPHAPPFLSVLIWSVFLPFFVAEMREWM